MDHNALIAAAHVHAALDLVPRIITAKEVWGPWMRDNLDKELVREPHPQALSMIYTCDVVLTRTGFP